MKNVLNIGKIMQNNLYSVQIIAFQQFERGVCQVASELICVLCFSSCHFFL